MASTPDDASEAADAVVCVDGITRAVIKGYTPDISWSAYVAWLRRRRPCLRVIHLNQPYDWLDIISGPNDQYHRVEQSMLRELMVNLSSETRRLVILGFSLGGLTALHLSYEIMKLLPQITLDYAAYISFGTPFAGTGRPQDVILRRTHQAYFSHMFNPQLTRSMLATMLELGRGMQIRILLGEIKRDEIVSASSSLHPVHWLTAAPLPPGVKWGTFQIESGQRVRAHDGLLYDPLSVAYIDGLVDGLLPSRQASFQYFSPRVLA